MAGETAGETHVADGAALVGWLLLALWGWVTFAGADDLRNDPRTIHPDEKATLLVVAGGLLLAIGLVLAGAAVIRLVGTGKPLTSPTVSLAFGIALLGAFVVLFVWGRTLTHGQGISAAGLVVVPYAGAGVAVLFSRRRRLERTSGTAYPAQAT